MKPNEKVNSTTTIFFIRHGETDWNSTGRLQGTEDVELNDSGREQALEIGRYFETEHCDIMVSSPLKRAYETAQIIASRLSIPLVHVVDDIKERSYGSASGLLPEERRNRFPDGVIPDQEEFEHLRLRAMTGLTKIATDFKGERIIVVSHGGLTNAILYSISDGEFGSFKTRLKNGCINKLIVQNDQWIVEFFNKTVDELINPMENLNKLYSENDIKTMRIAEEARLPGKNRVDEIISYAQKAGIKRIGIANCIGFQKDVEKLKARLAGKFEVFSVDCKVYRKKGINSAAISILITLSAVPMFFSIAIFNLKLYLVNSFLLLHA